MKKKCAIKAEESPSREIMRLVRDIHVDIRKRFMSKAQDMGYTMPQFMVMYELTSAGDMTMHDLIGRLKLPKSTVSRIIDQLVQKDMVVSTRPADNRRVVMLKASPCYLKGKIALKSLVVEDLDMVLSPAKAKKILSSLTELMETIKFA